MTFDLLQDISLELFEEGRTGLDFMLDLDVEEREVFRCKVADYCRQALHDFLIDYYIKHNLVGIEDGKDS